MLNFFSKNINNYSQAEIVRLFMVFIVLSVILFLLFVILFLFPRINHAVNDLQDQSDKLSVGVYSAHFHQYVNDRHLSLVDLARSPTLVNNLLLGDQGQATIQDYIVSLRLLGEDPTVVLLDFEGNIIFDERLENNKLQHNWVGEVLSGKKKFQLNLIDNSNFELFEMVLPVFYGGSIEGVLVVYFSAVPTDVFTVGGELNQYSAIEYSKNGNKISSDFSMMTLMHRETVLVSDYGVELTHISDRQYAQQQRNNLIQSLIYTAFLGAVLMLFFLFFLGRRIILQPYKSLVETQQAIELAVEGISRIDTEGRYISLNSAYAGVASYYPEELVGKAWDITVHPDDLPSLKQAYEEMLQKGKVTAEARGVRKNGSVFYKQVTMVSQYQDGEFVGHHCFMKEITEQKRQEIEREKLIESLVESNEWLEQFAFACSHDLQEPLRMVRVFSGKLEDVFEKHGIADEKAYHYLQYVLDGSTRAQELIASILNYSRLDRDVEKMQSVNLNEMLATLVDEVKEISEGVVAQFGFSDLPTVVANKTQLYQLFQNLLGNALKYQAANAAPLVEIGADDKDKYWQFYVRDNGIGIDERYIDKVFDVFKRLHTQTEYAGSGIGLAICKKVVERHGGLMWVESTLGEGSTFYFTILKAVDA